MSATYQRYPMVMNHPNYQPATMHRVNNGTPGMKGEAWAGDMQGTPVKFPPVTVNNEDQEEYHRAQGYVSAAGDEHEFNVARNNLNPTGYAFQEYPKWIDDGTPEGVTVTTPEEEGALRSRMMARSMAALDAQPIPEASTSIANPAPTAEELAAFRQWKAAQEAAAAAPAPRAKRAPRAKASYAERTRGTAAASSADGAPGE
ncbi:MAG: hypothetical protein PVS3B2_00330 [Candidatus Dormibacteraceae bacterium]